MSVWFHARTVVETAAAQSAVDGYAGQFNRFEDAFEALKWLLAHRCDDLPSLRRTVGGVEYVLYKQAGDIIANTPDITVVYTFDDDEVTILDVHAEEREDLSD